MECTSQRLSPTLPVSTPHTQPELDNLIRRLSNGDPCDYASCITQLEFENRMLRREVRMVRHLRDEQVAELGSDYGYKTKVTRGDCDRKNKQRRRAFPSVEVLLHTSWHVQLTHFGNLQKQVQCLKGILVETRRLV